MRLRKLLTASMCALLFGINGHAIAETVPLPLARQTVAKAVELIETRAVYPRKQEEYGQAKAELLALLEGRTEDIDRRLLSAALIKVLRTLDADGHSFVVSPTRYSDQQRTAPPRAEAAPTLKLVTTARGTALHWTPPQIVSSAMEARADYLKRFSDDAAALPQLNQACALVIDLTAQIGGNAWPPFIAMGPLFGAGNQAYAVDRDANRIRFVSPVKLQAMDSVHSADHPNPLARFANLPLAVVVGGRTASAGEMLLVALMGEGERVQTFGRTSAGMSTANTSYPMPDGSMLILTTNRYAVGEQPVIHGGIPVAHPAAPEDSAEAIVLRAAEWAVSKSPLCAAPPKI